MKAIGRLIMFVVVVVIAVYFFLNYRSTTPWAVGTGRIGGENAGVESTAVKSGSGNSSASPIVAVASDPAKWDGKTVTLHGRPYGTTKYASNRNIYTMVDGDSRVLVIADGEPPQTQQEHTVTGVVKTIGVGSLRKPYVVSVKGGAKVDPPDWKAVGHFFTDKYDEIKKNGKEAVSGG